MALHRKRGSVHTMRVRLQRVTPQVWRRFEVPGHLTLEEFHAVLQIGFGWSNSHLYEFEASGHTYGVAEDDVDGDGTLPTSALFATTVDDLVRAGSRFEYTYDFGDNWEHAIRVERSVPDRSVVRPRCIGGQRDVPEEDCGGVGGAVEDDHSAYSGPT